MKVSCRDLYKEKFKDYLIEFLKEEDRSISQVNQIAIDVFYLEKNCTEKDFMYWFQSDETFNEAREKLDELFKSRKSREASLKNYIKYMTWFKQFLLEVECKSFDNDYIDDGKRQAIKKISDENLKYIALGQKNKTPEMTVAKTTIYYRNPYVSEYAKRRANGICQLCGNLAPFKRMDGEPYLETHHIIWLSKGGEDTVENTVALCPNCHKKMHILNSREDIDILINRQTN